MKPSSIHQQKIADPVLIPGKICFLFILFCLFLYSCTKDDGNDDDPGTPAFEMNITGGITKKVTGNYAYVQFGDYQSPASGNTVYNAVISLGGNNNEFFSMGVTREGGIDKGTYDLSVLSFDPFLTSFANYTENNGATVYGPVSGTITFSGMSSKHITGSFNVVLEHGGTSLQVKGSFTAVTP